MAKIIRKLQKIFGSTAGATDIGIFGSFAAGVPSYTTNAETVQSNARYLQGWKGAILANSNPAIEDVNALDFLWSYQLSYLMQTGIPEWESNTIYFIGSVVNDGTGVLYRSIQDNNVNHSVGDVTWWALAAGGGLVNTPVSANVTAATGQALLVNSTAASRTIFSPTGVTGNQFLIIDDKKTAATNNILIYPPSGTAFQGMSIDIPLFISTNGTGYWFFWDGTNYTYIAVGGGSGGASITPAVQTASFTAANYSVNQIDHTAGGIIVGSLPNTALAAVVTFVYAKGTIDTTTNFFRAATTGGVQFINGYAAADTESFKYAFYSVTYSKAAGSNAWYGAYQGLTGINGGQLPGGTGAAIAAGYAGQIIYPAVQPSDFTVPTGALVDWPNANLVLPAGNWDIVANIPSTAATGATINSVTAIFMALTDSSNNQIGNDRRGAYAMNASAVVMANVAVTPFCVPLDITVPTTVKIRCQRDDSGSTGSGTIYGPASASGIHRGMDFFARRR